VHARTVGRGAAHRAVHIAGFCQSLDALEVAVGDLVELRGGEVVHHRRGLRRRCGGHGQVGAAKCHPPSSYCITQTEFVS
jgi:hypothetical protein